MARSKNKLGHHFQLSSGMSLVEVMIVLAISMGVAASVYANFGPQRDRVSFDNAIRSTDSIFTGIKNEVRAGVWLGGETENQTSCSGVNLGDNLSLGQDQIFGRSITIEQDSRGEYYLDSSVLRLVANTAEGFNQYYEQLCSYQPERVNLPKGIIPFLPNPDPDDSGNPAQDPTKIRIVFQAQPNEIWWWEDKNDQDYLDITNYGSNSANGQLGDRSDFSLYFKDLDYSAQQDVRLSAGNDQVKIWGKISFTPSNNSFELEIN